MQKKQTVEVGFIPAFKWADTLLFIGDGPSLRRLADLLESGPVSGDGIADLLNCHGIQLDVVVDADKTSIVKDGSRIVWSISPEHAQTYASQIRSLADGAGHHYLDAPGVVDIDVMVSQGEYDTGVFSR